jgi:hypothetical protein
MMNWLLNPLLENFIHCDKPHIDLRSNKTTELLYNIMELTQVHMTHRAGINMVYGATALKPPERFWQSENPDMIASITPAGLVASHTDKSVIDGSLNPWWMDCTCVLQEKSSLSLQKESSLCNKYSLELGPPQLAQTGAECEVKLENVGKKNEDDKGLAVWSTNLSPLLTHTWTHMNKHSPDLKPGSGKKELAVGLRNSVHSDTQRLSLWSVSPTMRSFPPECLSMQNVTHYDTMEPPYGNILSSLDMLWIPDQSTAQDASMIQDAPWEPLPNFKTTLEGFLPSNPNILRPLWMCKDVLGISNLQVQANVLNSPQVDQSNIKLPPLWLNDSAEPLHSITELVGINTLPVLSMYHCKTYEGVNHMLEVYTVHLSKGKAWLELALRQDEDTSEWVLAVTLPCSNSHNGPQLKDCQDGRAWIHVIHTCISQMDETWGMPDLEYQDDASVDNESEPMMEGHSSLAAFKEPTCYSDELQNVIPKESTTWEGHAQMLEWPSPLVKVELSSCRHLGMQSSVYHSRPYTGVSPSPIHSTHIGASYCMDIVRATLPSRPQTERGKRLINHMPITVGILSKQQHTTAMHKLAPIAVGILRDRNWWSPNCEGL